MKACRVSFSPTRVPHKELFKHTLHHHPILLPQTQRFACNKLRMSFHTETKPNLCRASNPELWNMMHFMQLRWKR